MKSLIFIHVCQLPVRSFCHSLSRLRQSKLKPIIMRWLRHATFLVATIMCEWLKRATILVTIIVREWPKRATIPVVRPVLNTHAEMIDNATSVQPCNVYTIMQSRNWDVVQLRSN